MQCIILYNTIFDACLAKCTLLEVECWFDSHQNCYVIAASAWLPQALVGRTCQHLWLGTPEQPEVLQSDPAESKLGQMQCDQRLSKILANLRSLVLERSWEQSEYPLNRQPVHTQASLKLIAKSFNTWACKSTAEGEWNCNESDMKLPDTKSHAVHNHARCVVHVSRLHAACYTFAEQHIMAAACRLGYAGQQKMLLPP